MSLATLFGKLQEHEMELRHGKDKGKQITWANLPNAKADISFS